MRKRVTRLQIAATYELRVRVDPAYRHKALGYLALEELDFVVHCTLILLAGLRWYD